MSAWGGYNVAGPESETTPWLRRHRGAAYFFYVSVVLVVGFAVAELAVRRIRPDLHLKTIAHRLERVQNRLLPDADFHHLLRGSDLDREFPAPGDPPTQRIMIVGDSYVHGSGVKRADRFAARLENSLGDDVAVSVLAMPSYSTIIYRNLVARAFAKARYRVVVLCVDQTDPADNLIYANDLVAEDAHHRFDVERMADRLQAVDASRRQLVAEITTGIQGDARRLTLINALFPIEFTPDLPSDSPHLEYVQQSYVERTGLYTRFADAPASPEVKRMEEMMFEHLDQIVALCRDHQAKLILTATPWEYQVSGDPVMRRQFRGPYPRTNRLERLLAERYGSSPDVQFVPMTSRFRERTAAGSELYLNNNIHWNNDGHALVAEILRPHVVTHLID